MLKAIQMSEDREAALEKTTQGVKKLREMKLPAAAKMIESDTAETFSYDAFPLEHHQSLRTHSSLERIMKEIRCRTRVVGSFPDGNSALILMSARLRHIAVTHWGSKRYLEMARLQE